MKVVESGAGMGARIEDMDLSMPLGDAQYKAIEHALGRYGVVSFPGQRLSSRQLKEFGEHFGQPEISVADCYQDADVPEVMILSNIVENGRPIGLGDAGQDWHTDMSYSDMIAFCNILYGIEIPQRDGEPLGCTEFSNMHAAYEGLPLQLRQKLDGMTITHDFNKFWEMMRRERGSARPALTPAQRRRKPPVAHPVFLTHPITGRKVLYANPGYSVRINELQQEESDRILAFLFEHQVQAKYRYRHRWHVGDVLMWDNMGTIHNAVADYTPHERRLIKRCQVTADKYF